MIPGAKRLFENLICGLVNAIDWRCRRAEITAEIQHYKIGEKPVRPDTIEASFSADTVLTGAGATFPAAAYQRWAGNYASETGHRVNYQSVGSGAGVRQFLAGSVDFGATDEQLSEDDFKADSADKRGAVQIPMLGGTVTPAYNNPSCPDLKLSQAQLADIFLGKIKTWEQLKCGKGRINVVHRSDGSGTTFAFTNSLSAFSPEFQMNLEIFRPIDLHHAEI